MLSYYQILLLNVRCGCTFFPSWQDTDRVCRLLGGTDKRLLPSVCATYLDAFGAALPETFAHETAMSGDLRAAAGAWCACRDPTAGAEGEMAVAVGARAAARAALRQRDALRDAAAEADAVAIHQ